MRNKIQGGNMRKFIMCLIIALSINQCDARTFGCFAGVLGMDSEQKLEVDYMHYQLFYHKKNTLGVLPFLGCGISFDF